MPPAMQGDHELNDTIIATPQAPDSKAKQGSFQSTATASALTPPTSEDNDIKNETRSESDLSEVNEEMEEEEEEIVPDHYYDGGKIPVFKPVSRIRPNMRASSDCMLEKEGLH